MSFSQLPVGICAILAQAVPEFTGDPYSVTDIVLPPTDAGARIQLLANGNVQGFRDNGADPILGTWGAGLTISDYDFRWDIISGSLSYTGTQAGNTWITGFANMYWGVEETGIGISQCTGTLRVRPTGGGSDFDTASVSVTAEATP